jgi:hypothetical protein
MFKSAPSESRCISLNTLKLYFVLLGNQHKKHQALTYVIELSIVGKGSDALKDLNLVAIAQGCDALIKWRMAHKQALQTIGHATRDTKGL